MVVDLAKARKRLGKKDRTNRVTLTVSGADRNNQLNARAELLTVCKAYLTVPEDKRNPDVAEQITLAVLDYLSGEEKAGL